MSLRGEPTRWNRKKIKRTIRKHTMGKAAGGVERTAASDRAQRKRKKHNRWKGPINGFPCPQRNQSILPSHPQEPMGRALLWLSWPITLPARTQTSQSREPKKMWRHRPTDHTRPDKSVFPKAEGPEGKREKEKLKWSVTWNFPPPWPMNSKWQLFHIFHRGFQISSSLLCQPCKKQMEGEERWGRWLNWTALLFTSNPLPNLYLNDV